MSALLTMNRREKLPHFDRGVSFLDVSAGGILVTGPDMDPLEVKAGEAFDAEGAQGFVVHGGDEGAIFDLYYDGDPLPEHLQHDEAA